MSYPNSAIISSSIILLLAVSIPNAHSDAFDDETCFSLISIDKVKEITGFDGTLEINVINQNLETLNEGIARGCSVAFQNEDTSFSLSLGISAAESEHVAQSMYGEIFSASHRMGFDVIEGNNGPWIHHLVEVNDIGIGSVTGSIKDNILVGLNLPQTDYPIESSAMLEMLKIIQSNVDELEIPKSFEPKAGLDLYDPSTSSGVNVIFDRCEDNDIWWGHVENSNGERITDAVAVLHSQTDQEIGQLSVSKKDGSFGTSTLGQDPSGTVGRIEVRVDGEPPVFVDDLSCVQSTDEKTVDNTESKNGGGCLIATATYGSELAPQVQQLRELRDNSLLQTESGTSFIKHFNDAYYSFSPIIADYERENPMFREMVKIIITPMISSLSVLNHVNMDSEQSVLGYGISLIVLNLAMYVGVPVVAIVGIRKKF